MRLVRFDAKPARVSEDIRAALASIGRGDSVVGGIGLVGVTPMTRDPVPVDAVLILPRGVLVVVGVDLPDPAMRLDAPLNGQWKVDGWPIVPGDKAVNPAIGALSTAGLVAATVRDAVPTVPTGTVVAVGPFVDNVEQSPADLAGSVRVIHPTSTSMLAATVSLASARQPLSATGARSILRALAPDVTPPDDDALVAEGFARPDPAQASPTPPPPLAPSLPQAQPAPSAPPAPSAQPTPYAVPGSSWHAAQPLAPVARPRRPRTLPSLPASIRGRLPAGRWQALAAGAVLFAIVIAAITIALGGDEPAEPPPPTTNAAPVLSAGGLRFAERAGAVGTDCAAPAVGDLRVALAEDECTEVRRASFRTSAGGRDVAVSVAWLTFADETAASSFHDLANTPGTGTIADIATESGGWQGKAPPFDNAAYATALEGATVKLVLADVRGGPSTPDDPELTTVAQRALDLNLAR